MNCLKSLFIKNFAFILIFIFFSCDINEEKPNIIWIVCEDQSTDFFPFYGDNTAQLPNLEMLAKESVIYTNMHATTPVCAPARSSIITGMYPTSIGTHNMRAYSYDLGKKENQPQINIPIYSSRIAENIPPFTEYMRDQGYFCTNRDKMDYNFKISENTWDINCHQRMCSKDNLYDRAHWKSRNGNQPFFSVFNLPQTHESKIWQHNKNDILVDIKKISPPPYFPNDSVIIKDMAINYSNLILMDEKVGEIINQLKKDELYEDSYIFFYSDHGGPFPRHKRAIYESGTKVPLLVKFPKSKNAGKIDNSLLSFVDFAPTVLNISGSKIPDYIQGKAFIGKNLPKKRKFLITTSDRFDGQIDRVRAIQNHDFKLIKNYNLNTSHNLDVKYRKNMPMMRRLNNLFEKNQLNNEQERWFLPREEYEFYDLKNDPYELKNIVENEKYAKLIEELKFELNKWIKLTNDLGEKSEYDIIKESNIRN